MIFLKKSSIFFSKFSKFYINLFKNDIFAIYNFFGVFSLKKLREILDLNFLNYILVSTSFINLIFIDKIKRFFKFISNFSIVFFFFRF